MSRSTEEYMPVFQEHQYRTQPSALCDTDKLES